MVEEGNVSGSNDHGVGAVGQLGALDDGDLVEIIGGIAVFGSPDVVLLIEDHHVALIGLGG